MQTSTQDTHAHKYSLEEYAALRNEIVSISEQSRNIWITMITLYLTLFVVALQTSSLELVLLTYIILIPFQSLINAQRWSIQKISTYIRLFFEEENTGIHWETMHVYPPYLAYRKKFGDEKITNTFSALLMGGLSSVWFIASKIHLYITKALAFSLTEGLWLIAAVGLFVVLTVIYFKYYTHYEDGLMEIFTDYKNHIRQKEKHNQK